MFNRAAKCRKLRSFLDGDGVQPRGDAVTSGRHDKYYRARLVCGPFLCRQQQRLARLSPPVPASAPGRRHDAVARDDNRDGIGGAGIGRHVRTAALAGPEARRPGFGSRIEKADAIGAGPRAPTTGPAVHADGRHAVDEGAICGRVARCERLPPHVQAGSGHPTSRHNGVLDHAGRVGQRHPARDPRIAVRIGPPGRRAARQPVHRAQ